MFSLVYLLVAFVASALSALVFLPWILRHAYSRGLYTLRGDERGDRKPLRLGGAIFAPSTLIGLTLSMVLMNEGEDLNQSMKTSSMLLGCGVMMIYIIGLLDDLFGLSVKIRFFIQIIAACSLPLCGLYFTDLHGLFGIDVISVEIGVLMTVLFTVCTINAVNMIDGIDGLVSIYAMLCLLCFGYCFCDSANLIYGYIAAAMIGSLVVFLCFNLFGSIEKKTKTHMGDSGSMMLGFSLAYLSVKYICSEHDSSIDTEGRVILCMSMLFVPCIDLCRVLLERLFAGEHPFKSDKRHIHYQIMFAGIYGRMTLLCVIALMLVIAISNLISALLGCSVTLIFVLDVLLYSIFMGLLTLRIRTYRNRMVLRSNLQERFLTHAKSARKICILTPRFPIPENGGDVLRINNIARQLRADGYELVLVSFVEDDAPHLFDAERIYNKVYCVHRNVFNSIWQSAVHLFTGRPLQCGYYYSAHYRQVLENVIKKEKPDLFIAHLLRMMPYLDALHLHDCSIIEMTDALSKTYSLSSSSKGNWLLRLVYRLERHLIRRAEQYSMMYFPVNVLVSDADAQYLRTISPHNSSLVVRTNGVDVTQSVLTDYDPNKIVFVGNMRTLQNQDAVLFFVQEIFPRILSRIPSAKFYIVGAQAPPRILELASDNIIVTGFVDDLVSTIQDSAVAVAPVRVAAGIQNKVLVAMGCGLPVVLTSLISHAIPELEDDTNCIIRDEAATIADSCIRLMKHPQERNVIAKAGYELVCQNYTWKEKMRGYILGR